jgi:hypothetical protein
MSEEVTPRLAMPLLHAGQAQKELDHNEALALLDIAAQAAVKSRGLDAPPAEPAEGACWIVGPTPVGEWAGHAGALAGWTAGGWRFVAPFPGLAAWVIDEGCSVRHLDGGWSIAPTHTSGVYVDGSRVLGARQPAIAEPVGGGAVDVEARVALAAVLAALRTHGLIAT